jgi:hypothetical protein
MPSRKLARTALGLAVLAVAAIAGAWIVAAIQRTQAIESFGAALASAQPGHAVDVREAFPLDWDRVVIIGPYEPGYSANEALGFEYDGEYDDLISGDSGQMIVFVEDGSVVADIRNWGPTWFAEDIRTFQRADAVFVRKSDGWLYRSSGPT